MLRPPHHRRLRAAGALLGLVAVLVSGCAGVSGEGNGTSTGADLRGGSIAREYDLRGAEFTVGSKEFTEQTILGEIMSNALRAAGARTQDQTGLSGSTITRQALTNREIDMYWEYSGTAWSLYLGHDDPVPGERAQYEAVKREDEQRNGIAWLGPARFGNKYAIARAADASGPAGRVDDLEQLARLAERRPEEASICGAAEFLDREFGPMQQTYDFRIPSKHTYQNDFALNFVNAAKGSPCNFAEVFTTDARLKSLNLEVLEDPRTHFDTQLAALTVREETVREHPQIRELARRIGQDLTMDTMIELNGMVDMRGATPEEAALHFLREHGYIGGDRR
ncbi:glycine betaine ABC transporter substrate-binding protein [Salinifilum ghardaiensis]